VTLPHAHRIFDDHVGQYVAWRDAGVHIASLTNEVWPPCTPRACGPRSSPDAADVIRTSTHVSLDVGPGAADDVVPPDRDAIGSLEPDAMQLAISRGS
jgi:hypothetical protein